MKRLSFFTKIFSGSFLIIIILLTLIVFSTFRIINKHYLNTLTIQLKNSAILVKNNIAFFFNTDKQNRIAPLVKKLGSQINTRITVINKSGIVLGDSEDEPLKMENHKDRPEIKEALNNRMGKSLRYSTTVSERMLYIAIPVKKNGKITGVVRTSLFLKEIDRLLVQLKIKVFYITIFIIFLSIIGIYFFSNTLSRPIRKIIKASRQIAKGDFETKIFLKNKDELKELADSFNYMTSQIKDLFHRLSYEKEHINSIIFSVEEGILVINKDGEIVLSNNSIRNIINNEDIEGRLYWEVIRNFGVNDLIEEIKKKKKNISREIDFNNKIFVCSGSALLSGNEIVLVFHDITQRKNLEEMKKDLVANVSHELRTPLTAIKGFVETIYDQESNTKNKHYLDIINRHTDRLISIINDLLTLSRLEDSKVFLEIKKVNLNTILKNIFKIFEIKLKNKPVKLKINIDKDVPLFKGDDFKIEQMFVNLIDNAIKYTDKGDIKINVIKKNNFIVITIEDTGIGIPEKHLKRIFERFYVVDKSRSRQLGGTGLGLSIVKYIVLLHNGRINVESEHARGTKFTISLPQNVT